MAVANCKRIAATHPAESWSALRSARYHMRVLNALTTGERHRFRIERLNDPGQPGNLEQMSRTGSWIQQRESHGLLPSHRKGFDHRAQPRAVDVGQLPV